MKKVCLSIPIHTALDVVAQHIDNIFYFVKNSIVVLHITADQSQSFYNEVKEFESRWPQRVLINDKRYSTFSAKENVLGLSSIHASNYQYAKSLENFDVFSIHASNEMFVRPGVENSYDNYKIGISNYEPGYPGGIEKACQDSWIQNIKQIIKIENVYWGGVVEGTFFDSNIMEGVAKIVLSMPEQPVSAEPLVLNTIALNLYPELVSQGTQRVTFTTLSQIVDDNMIRRTFDGTEGHERCYALKTVPRQIDHPVRLKINNLIQERYGKT